MLEKYIEKNGKKLRYGYTTGSCATATSKASAYMILSGEKLDEISIDTPKGWKLNLKLNDVVLESESASCAVIKDGGDDPDITNGKKIFAEVKKISDKKIEFKAGKGLGIVTQKGLSIGVGEPAINPVPRKMIKEELKKVSQEFNYEGGFEVKISVEDGEELALRTFNPKLGIKGGISIIGSTGIVEPMSEESIIATMKLELSILLEKGYFDIIYAIGNYSKNFSKNYELPEEKIIKIGNYSGLMLDEAENKNIKSILYIGDIGKLIKVAGGIFNTHSKIADGRMEILASYFALFGGSREGVSKILNSITTDEAMAYIESEKIEGIYDYIANKIKERAIDRTHKKVEIEVILFARNGGLLACTDGVESLVKKICTN